MGISGATIREVETIVKESKKEATMNKLNLVPAIKAVEEQINEITIEYRKKLEPFKESLKHLRQINQACERCNGEGKIHRPRSCAEDDVDDDEYISCPICRGTGLVGEKYEREDYLL